MPRPRKPHTVWRVCIDPALAQRAEDLLYDPVRGRTRYGARGELIEYLLRTWLDSMDEKPKAIDMEDL